MHTSNLLAHYTTLPNSLQSGGGGWGHILIKVLCAQGVLINLYAAAVSFV